MAPWRPASVGSLAGIALSSLLPIGALGAQQSTLRGVVIDRSTGQGVIGAQLVLVDEKRTVVADSQGSFKIYNLPPGRSRLVVRALGFPPRQLNVELSPGAITDQPIQLDSTDAGRLTSAQALPSMSVTAPSTPVNYRLVDFERRRQNGRGQYLTEDEIAKSGAYNVADAVKNMRGVTYECGGGAGCFVRMARAPMRCLPEYIVDGREMNDFGPTTPIRDIVGLEVYTGPTEVPGEYAGRYAGCGVIVIWTRSGPTRKKR